MSRHGRDLEGLAGADVIDADVARGMNSEPIAGGDFGRADNKVACDPPVFHLVTFRWIGHARTEILAGGWSGLVIVVDQIDSNITIATVTTVVAPVVDHVVPQVHQLIANRFAFSIMIRSCGEVIPERSPENPVKIDATLAFAQILTTSP